MAERDRDSGMEEYIASLKRRASESDDDGLYTPDFIVGFEHAWRMVQAFEAEWSLSEGTAKPEVREAARQVLALMERSA